MSGRRARERRHGPAQAVRELPPLFVTDSDARFQVAPDLALVEPRPSEYGIEWDPTHLATMHFAGVDPRDIRAGLDIDVILALPDLVLLREQCAELIRRAETAGVLRVPEDIAERVVLEP